MRLHTQLPPFSAVPAVFVAPSLIAAKRSEEQYEVMPGGGRRPERRLLAEDILYTFFVLMAHSERSDFPEFTSLRVHVRLWKWVGVLRTCAIQ